MMGVMSSLVPIAADLLRRPTVLRVLAAWSVQPLVVVPLFVAGWLYLAGVRAIARRYPRAPWPRSRTAWFLAGLGSLYLVLQSPIDAYANVLLWIHMLQHVVIMMASAPMLLLGAPITLALRAAGSGARKRFLLPVLHSPPVVALSNPVVAWCLFAGVIVGTHFSPLYEAALEHAWIHDVEHLLYLGSALLFWWPVIARDPSRWRLPHALRGLYVFLAAPVNTFVALAIYSAGHVLYPHYALVVRSWGPGPLADQRWAGALMWILGDLTLLAEVLFIVAGWARHEEAVAARLDEQLDRQAARAASSHDAEGNGHAHGR